MGDNRHQFDTADLMFDDTTIPEMRKDFIKQDKALFKMLMAKLPVDHPLKSRFMEGLCIHNMGTKVGETYKVIPNSA